MSKSKRRTAMKPEEVVTAFFEALKISGREAAAEYLAEGYTSETPPLP